jgi:XapX domain-containing protein
MPAYGPAFLFLPAVEVALKIYLASLAAGLLVGVIYSLINVRSPAPPVIALIGLLGILAGEQIPPLVKSILSEGPTVQSWLGQVRPHMFGHLPKAPDGLAQMPASERDAAKTDS